MEEKTGDRLLEVTFYFTYQSKKKEWKETLPECCEHEGRGILIRQENKAPASIKRVEGP